MRKLTLILAGVLMAITSLAQGWPANYGGVMMQGFFWDSYLPMPDCGPNGTAQYSKNRKPVDPNLTWATIYGAGWGEGNDEWPVPITTWAGLMSSKQYIAPYIDLLWLPQSGATIAEPTMTYNGEYCQRPWYGSSDPTGQSGSVWKYYNGNTISHTDCNGFVPYYWFNHGRDGLKTYFGTEQELRQLISEYKAAGTGAIEDVVINHKGYVGDFFVNETYVDRFGNTRSTNWTKADLTTTTPGGEGQDDGEIGTWAKELAHTSTNVQENTMNYLNFLKNDLGYIGFRFDFARGIAAKHFTQYNKEVKATYSVGEYWDHGTDVLKNFVRNTNEGDGPMSAAFDFPLHDKMREAFNDESGEGKSSTKYRILESAGMIWNYQLKRYAVTFVENHDTFKWLPTDNTAPDYQHRTNHHVMEANAFILAMPGTPCLFYAHFMKDWNKPTGWHADFVKLIHARRAAGITNEAAIWPSQKIGSYGIAWHITGNKGDVWFGLGREAVNQGVPSGFTEIWRGDDAIYCISNNVVADYNAMSAAGYEKPHLIEGYPVIDKRSGAYSGSSLTVNVKPSSPGTTLVYTTNGTTPTGSSRRITDAVNGENITFNESGTLKVGVLIDNAMVQGSMTTREYALQTPSGGNNTFTIYVKADNTPKFYLWTEDEHNKELAKLNGDWPGGAADGTKTIGGIQWYYKTVSKPATGTVNLIINWCDGNEDDATAAARKTQVVRNIDNDIFYVIFDQVPTDVTNDYLHALDNPKVTIDMPTGEYEGKLTANLTATNSDAVIYYTTDGSEPTTSSQHATFHTTVTFDTDDAHVLRAAVLHNGQLINKVSRSYWLKNASEVVSWENKTPETVGITVYVEASKAPSIYAWKYNDGTTATTLAGAWPGTTMSEIRKVGDKEYYYWHTNESACKFKINDGVNGSGKESATIKAASSGSYFYTYDGNTTATDVSTSRSLVTVDLNKFNDTSSKLYIFVRDEHNVNTAPYCNYWTTEEGTGISQLSSYVTVDGERWYYRSFGWINNGNGGISFATSSGKANESASIGQGYTVNYNFQQGNLYWFRYYSNGDGWKINKDVNTNGYLTELVQAPTRTNRYSSEQKKVVSTVVNVNSTDFPSCASPLGDDYYYFYYENSIPYNDPFVWVWNGTKVYSGSCWPGEALVEVVGTSATGKLIYRWAYRKSAGEVAPAYVIFNNYGDKSTQSPDLAFHNGGYYRGNQYLGQVTGGTSYTLAGLISSNETQVSDGTDVTKKYVIENDVYVGYADYINNKLFVRDADGEALNYSVPVAGQNLYEEPSNYDQANWMEIEFTAGDLPEGLEGKLIMGQTLYGWLVDKQNPKFKTDYDPLQLQVTTPARHLYNSYYIINFLEDRGPYFWVDPKPQEYVEIQSVMYDPDTQSFYAHPNTQGLGVDITERIPVSAGDYWNSQSGGTWNDVLSKMSSQGVYGLTNVTAIVKVNSSSSGAPAAGGRRLKEAGTAGYTLSLVSASPSVVTEIETIKGDSDKAKTVQAVRYYNLMGVGSNTPFDGVNIVVTTYTDGTQSSTKLLR